MSRNNKQDLTNNETLTINVNNLRFNPDAIFIDLDGTLLDSPFKRISKKNIEAIKKQQQLCPIIISTGRSYNKKVKHLMQLLDIEYAICQNGAVIAKRNGYILKNISLTKDQIDPVVDIVKEKKLGFTINSEFLIFTDHWIWASFTFLWRKKWKKIKKFNCKDYNVNKIVVAGYLKREKIFDLSAQFANSIPNASVKTSGRDKIVEITNEDATKGKAAQFIAKMLNVDIKKCVHIGDSENDSTTLGKVGALIAMEDSSTKLLELATHIGPKHKKAGIAKLFNGQIKEIKK